MKKKIPSFAAADAKADGGMPLIISARHQALRL
jgi:hypothetical protein